MPNRRERELAEARAARERIEAESAEQIAEAQAVRRNITNRAPRLESVVNYLAERQRRNHFGGEFDLTLIPRRRHP